MDEARVINDPWTKQQFQIIVASFAAKGPSELPESREGKLT
jgi:hypothetical protein